MPRPRALDDVKRGEVCALVSTGCSLQTAARYVGCSAVTIRREATRNADFYDQIRQAEIACQVSPLRAMRQAAKTHWRAAAWLLERTDPQQFGRRNPDQLTPNQLKVFTDQIGEILATNITDIDLLQRICDEFQEAGRRCGREARATEKPLFDPRRRQRSRDVVAPPPDPPPAGWESTDYDHAPIKT